MPPTVALGRCNRPAVTGALARIITHWREVAAPHGCHFENYLAQDLRITRRRSFKIDNQAVRSAKLSLSVIGGSGHGTLRQQGGARERRGARPGCRGGPPTGSAGCEGGDRRRAGQSGPVVGC